MTPSEIIISACESVRRLHGREQVEAWTRSSSLFCEVSSSPLNDFLTAEEVLNESGASIVDIVSGLAAGSFEWELERSMFVTTQKLANMTGLTALRFTVAWLAFNMNDFETCITECEKIDDHGYHVHGLMGQAYLENGMPDQAINCLRIAAAMNDRDAAIWFQLAKACFVASHLEEAWRALDACANVTGLGPEIVVLQCAVACAACELDPATANQMREQALQSVKAIYHRDQNKGLLLIYASKLAIFSGSQAAFIEEIRSFEALAAPEAFKGDHTIIGADISEVLKALQKRAWYQAAATLLGILTGNYAKDGPAKPVDPASA